jgi:hypothetical protein
MDASGVIAADVDTAVEQRVLALSGLAAEDRERWGQSCPLLSQG